MPGHTEAEKKRAKKSSHNTHKPKGKRGGLEITIKLKKPTRRKKK